MNDQNDLRFMYVSGIIDWNAYRERLLELLPNRIEPDVRPVYDMTTEEQRVYEENFRRLNPGFGETWGSSIQVLHPGERVRKAGSLQEKRNQIYNTPASRDAYVPTKEQAERDLYYEVTGRQRFSHGVQADHFRYWRDEYTATGQSYAFDQMMRNYEPGMETKPAITRTVKKYCPQWDRLLDAAPVLIILTGILVLLLLTVV
jgi:hypothetical protein